MTDFAKLKKKSNSVDDLRQKAQALKDKKFQQDERYWTLTADKAGNGSALIRFLPPFKGEDDYWVRMWKHGFKNEKTGFWYIENSLTTIGENDYIGEYNNLLWNSGSDTKKEQARKQKRKLQYISNIYVIKDEAKPENQGKVFLFSYGQKIFDKIQACMDSEEEGEAFNPFDLWTGANFSLKVKKVGEHNNYDDSKFGAQKPLSDDDAVLEKIYESEYSLKAEIGKDKFKSKEELKKQAIRVLGFDPLKNQGVTDTEEEFENKSAPAPEAKTAQAKTAEAVDEDSPPWDTGTNASSGDDDDDIAAFKKLMAE